MSEHRKASPLRTAHLPAKLPAGLRRSLWGLTEAHAARTLAQQEQAFNEALEEQERARRSLELEVQGLRQRVELHRQTTDLLMKRLAQFRESAQNAAHMVAQEAERIGRERAAIADLKFESVRASAELQLERQAFREFLLDLHALLAGRGLLPPDLAVKVPPGPERPAGDQPDWQPLLAGRIVARTVKTRSGQVIATAGERVGAETISAAERNGLLPDLFVAVRVP